MSTLSISPRFRKPDPEEFWQRISVDPTTLRPETRALIERVRRATAREITQLVAADSSPTRQEAWETVRGIVGEDVEYRLSAATGFAAHDAVMDYDHCCSDAVFRAFAYSRCDAARNAALALEARAREGVSEADFVSLYGAAASVFGYWDPEADSWEPVDAIRRLSDERGCLRREPFVRRGPKSADAILYGRLAR